jgi:hypothetical protein
MFFFFYLISIPKYHFIYIKKIVWSHDKMWIPKLVFPSNQWCPNPNYWSLTENPYYGILQGIIGLLELLELVW